jgi:hypothetical protein
MGRRLNTPRTTFTATRGVEEFHAEVDIEGGPGRGIDDAERDHGDQGDHEVGGRAGEADHDPPEPAVAQAGRGDRHRPAPAEAGDDQGDGPERVEVRDRVEGEPTLGAGRLVTLEGGDRGVAELMEGDADDDRDHEGHEQRRFVAEQEQR